MKIYVVTVTMLNGREYKMDMQKVFRTNTDLERWLNEYYRGWSSVITLCLPSDDYSVSGVVRRLRP